MASTKRLEGAAKYLDRRAVVEDPRTAERDALQERANDASDVRDILNDMGCDIPEGADGWKFHCPFGIEHPDGGIDKTARYYVDSNSAFCFAVHGVLTPVRLTVMRDGVTYRKAAERLLALAGKPLRQHWRDRYADVANHVSVTRAQAATPAYAITALQIRLSDFPAHASRQFDADFRAAMEDRLAALRDTEPEFDAYTRWVEDSVDALARLL